VEESSRQLFTPNLVTISWPLGPASDYIHCARDGALNHCNRKDSAVYLPLAKVWGQPPQAIYRVFASDAPTVTHSAALVGAPVSPKELLTKWKQHLLARA